MSESLSYVDVIYIPPLAKMYPNKWLVSVTYVLLLEIECSLKLQNVECARNWKVVRPCKIPAEVVLLLILIYPLFLLPLDQDS